MLGLFGYLVALVAFGYEGLFTGGADAHDQFAGGMAAAYMVALVASVAVPVAVLRMRQRSRRVAAGLLGGMAVGIVLLVLLSVRIFDLMDDVASTCPCEPIVDQVRFSSEY
ncbi:MAG: hypothetical protein QOH18_1859 [Solirubrobacterales bacterium]|nr:hypothetical protein [Solirubrobacterales bacterium]